MTVPTVACTNCGKPFTTDDLRGTNCRYCGTLLAHHARAQQQVAVINQMLADRNGNGIPDAYEGLVANAQANAMNQVFGMGQPYGQPMAGPMQPMAGPMHPMMSPAVQIHAANMQVAQVVTRTASTITIVVVVIILLTTLLILGVGVAVWLLADG